MTLLDVYALGCDHGLMATGTVAGTVGGNTIAQSAPRNHFANLSHTDTLSHVTRRPTFGVTTEYCECLKSFHVKPAR